MERDERKNRNINKVLQEPIKVVNFSFQDLQLEGDHPRDRVTYFSENGYYKICLLYEDQEGKQQKIVLAKLINKDEASLSVKEVQVKIKELLISQGKERELLAQSPAEIKMDELYGEIESTVVNSKTKDKATGLMTKEGMEILKLRKQTERLQEQSIQIKEFLGKEGEELLQNQNEVLETTTNTRQFQALEEQAVYLRFNSYIKDAYLKASMEKNKSEEERWKEQKDISGALQELKIQMAMKQDSPRLATFLNKIENTYIGFLAKNTEEDGIKVEDHKEQIELMQGFFDLRRKVNTVMKDRQEMQTEKLLDTTVGKLVEIEDGEGEDKVKRRVEVKKYPKTRQESFAKNKVLEEIFKVIKVSEINDAEIRTVKEEFYGYISQILEKQPLQPKELLDVQHFLEEKIQERQKEQAEAHDAGEAK